MKGPHAVFSVLVCGVPRRLATHTLPLVTKLLDQARGLPVEVLCLVDNYYRTTGEKRNEMLQLARGDYVAFVDDDDDVSDTYVETILDALGQHPEVDFLGFVLQYNIADPNGAYTKTVEHSLDAPDGVPLHTQVVRRALALQAAFSAKNWGEDQTWTREIRLLVQSEVFLPMVLYHYNWHPTVSESREDVLGSWG